MHSFDAKLKSLVFGVDENDILVSILFLNFFIGVSVLSGEGALVKRVGLALELTLLSNLYFFTIAQYSESSSVIFS